MPITAMVAAIGGNFGSSLGTLPTLGIGTQHIVSTDFPRGNISVASHVLGPRESPGVYVGTAGVAALVGRLSGVEGIVARLGENGHAVTTGTPPAELIYRLDGVYGMEAVCRISGRFAGFVARADTVHIFSDHAGTVPIYHCWDKGARTLLIASEIKALIPLLSRGVELRPFPEALSVGNGERTAFRGIYRVPGGHACRIVLGKTSPGFETIRYWHLPDAPTAEAIAPHDDSCSAELLSALDRAVARCLSNADSTPPGVVLSGGVDSSAIVALTALRVPRLHTFCLGTSDTNEFEAARLVAQHCSTEHHEIAIDESDIRQSLPALVWATESAQARFAEYTWPLFLAYQYARKHTQFVLSGYGSDILFGGCISPKTSPDELQTHCQTEYASVEWSNEFSPSIGLAGNVWTEHPFWDEDFLRLAMALHPQLKGKYGIPKYILRYALRELLPEATVWRRKIGSHEGSGIQATFSSWLGVKSASAEEAMERKDRALYDMLRLLFIERAPLESLPV